MQKCGGGLRFGTHCVLYDAIGSRSERVLACLGRERAIQDPEPGTFDCDPRARAGWFLGVAQQESRSVYVLACTKDDVGVFVGFWMCPQRLHTRNCQTTRQ